mmetsp:Transcript_36023/g.80179  ORF Transcript_36023/g.80179 Transcript_36023/m.80179 type:complete len:193 (+) Transcript_36023:100-678(+)
MSVTEQQKKVLSMIMEKGHFDEIRKKAVEHLRQNEELKRHTLSLIEDSAAVSNADLSSVPKKKLLEELRKELEDTLIDKASKLANAMMNSPDNEVGRLVQQRVHEALCEVVSEEAQQQQAAAAMQQHEGHYYNPSMGGHPQAQHAAGAWGTQGFGPGVYAPGAQYGQQGGMHYGTAGDQQYGQYGMQGGYYQ